MPVTLNSAKMEIITNEVTPIMASAEVPESLITPDTQNSAEEKITVTDPITRKNEITDSSVLPEANSDETEITNVITSSAETQNVNATAVPLTTCNEMCDTSALSETNSKETEMKINDEAIPVSVCSKTNVSLSSDTTNVTKTNGELSGTHLLLEVNSKETETSNATLPVSISSAINGNPLQSDMSKGTQEQSKKNNVEKYRCESDSWSEDEDDSSSASSSSWDTSSDSDFFQMVVENSGPKRIPAAKTRGELELDDLPPIEDLVISVEKEEMELIGKIHAVVEKLVVIHALKNMKALDLDSILFLSHDKPLGRVFDVFGPVVEPFYCVRFNSTDQIKEIGIEIDADVFFAPEKNDITTYVFLNELQKQKGSDASWRHNNEPPEECLDFSDDEKERSAKRKTNIRNRNRRFSENSDVAAKRPLLSSNLNSRPYHKSTYQSSQNDIQVVSTSFSRNNSYSQSNYRASLSPGRDIQVYSSPFSRRNTFSAPIHPPTPPRCSVMSVPVQVRNSLNFSTPNQPRRAQNPFNSSTPNYPVQSQNNLNFSTASIPVQTQNPLSFSTPRQQSMPYSYSQQSFPSHRVLQSSASPLGMLPPSSSVRMPPPASSLGMPPVSLAMPPPASPFVMPPPASRLVMTPPASHLIMQPTSSALVIQPPASPLMMQPTSSPLMMQPPASPLLLPYQRPPVFGEVTLMSPIPALQSQSPFANISALIPPSVTPQNSFNARITRHPPPNPQNIFTSVNSQFPRGPSPFNSPSASPDSWHRNASPNSLHVPSNHPLTIQIPNLTSPPLAVNPFQPNNNAFQPFVNNLNFYNRNRHSPFH